MANSVGTVSVDLEARIAKFESDFGRAARIAEANSERIQRTAKNIANVLGAGISIAGVTAFVKSAIDAQDAISKMAQKVGVSTEALSGWQLAAQQAGVENDAFQKGLVKLAQSAAMVLQGSKQQVDAFKAIGVSALDSSGHLKNLDVLFPQVIDKLSKYRDGTAKTAIATQLFGRAGAELIPLFNAGAEGLRKYTKIAEDFGLVVGSKSAKAAEDFNDDLEQLSFVAKGVAMQFASALAPAIDEVTKKALAFFSSDKWKDALADISEGAKAIADHIGDVAHAIKMLATNLDEIAVFVGARFVFAKIAAGMTLASAATASLTEALLLLRGALALAGGWIGIVVTSLAGVAVAIYNYSKRTSQAEEATDSYAKLLDKLHGSSADQLADSRKLAESRAEEAKKTIAAAQAELALMEARLHAFEAQKTQLAEAANVPGMRVDSRMGASYAATAAAQTKKNIDAQLAFIAANKKGLEAIQLFLATSVAPPKAAVVDPKLPKDLNLVNEAAIAAASALDAYRKKQNDLSAKAADVVLAYNSKDVDPVTRAWNDYAAAVQKVAEAEGQKIAAAQDAQKAGIKGIDIAKVEADAQRDTATAIDSMTAARERNVAAAERELDVGGRMVKDMQEETRMYGMSERAAFIARKGIEAETELRRVNVNATQDQIDATKARVEAMAAEQYDTQKFIDFQKQVSQEYQGFWENATSSVARQFGDLFTGQTKKWSDFGRGLKSIAQQFVSDIIAQFVRLRILGPLMAGAMGTVAGWLGMGMMGDGGMLQQSANYYGSGSTIGGAAGATGGAGGGAGSYAGFLQNGVGAYKAYQWASTGGIWGSPAGAGASTAGTGVYGVNMPGGSVVYGNSAISAPYSPFGGTAGIGGYAVPYASIGGGLLGAYYGSKQGGGGFSTVASTVSYGALGAGIAGTAAGVAGGASLGAAAGGAFGAAAGMSWIPVVGWVLAAMALVDMVSGGKLFGTKYKTAASDATLRIGAEGGEASASLYQTKQRALFGGRKTRVVQQDVPPELEAAADALYNSVEKVMVQGAQKLGVDVPAMIEASLNTHTTYNDKGQVRATEYVVDYLGRTWKEATAEAAASRIGAEALVATVAASAGAVAQTIAEQWRDSAETLLDGAQTMLAAQIDINRGNSLIALGATATLSQIIKFVQSMQADGEKLADTYARLAQASAAYVQFVAQFAPQATGFGASLQAINKQMLANIDQANQLAQAAGMQHAAESDLANIHRVAAEQAAAAITQLSAAAQDLASKLYGAVSNTLASVTAQIDKLTVKTQAAAQLAIGDKSPLDDKAKLDIALKGLRSGITSADDVLALGRKLYASSADYTGLFNKVSEILQLPGATGAQGIDGALTDYNKLIGQRDQLQAQADAMARFNDAKTLAQYVADISTTHGIGYNEAASGLGFSLADLGKDLGITNIAGYLDTLQQQDIAGTTLTASSSIVDAIRQLGHDLIATITGAPIVQPGPTSGTTVVQSTPEQLALLQKLSGQLDVLITNTADTAQSNQKMAKDGTSDMLRNISAMARGATA